MFYLFYLFICGYYKDFVDGYFISNMCVCLMFIIIEIILIIMIIFISIII